MKMKCAPTIVLLQFVLEQYAIDRAGWHRSHVDVTDDWSTDANFAASSDLLVAFRTLCFLLKLAGISKAHNLG